MFIVFEVPLIILDLCFSSAKPLLKTSRCYLRHALHSNNINSCKMISCVSPYDFVFDKSCHKEHVDFVDREVCFVHSNLCWNDISPCVDCDDIMTDKRITCAYYFEL